MLWCDMQYPTHYPIRTACPPGSCACGQEELLNDPQGDKRILRLTKAEEQKLIARIEAIATLPELHMLEQRLYEQLGITLHIAPGTREVRTVRDIDITFTEQPGLCKKTRSTIPAAIRRCFEQHPTIVYALLDAQGLFDAA